MADRETLSTISSLREEFARKAQKEYPDIIVPGSGRNGSVTADFYAKLADKMNNAASALERGDLATGLVQLQEMQSTIASRTSRLEYNGKDCGRFSDKRTVLVAQADELKSISQQLDTAIRSIAYDEKRQLEKMAASPDAMLRRSEILYKEITYHNHYSNIADIQQILVLSAQIQQRQEKLIKELSEKVERLEKQLAEQPEPILDKSRLAPPSRPPQP